MKQNDYILPFIMYHTARSVLESIRCGIIDNNSFVVFIYLCIYYGACAADGGVWVCMS